MVQVSMISGEVINCAHTHISIEQQVGSSGVDDGGITRDGARRD